jgi:hypothetical protein
VKSTVVIDVDAPAKEVASLFANPSINVQWMHEIERYEPISGKQGMPGSVYRLIPKTGTMLLTATVVKRFPDQLYLNLEADNVTVEVHGTIKTLENGRTRLISKENFKFKGVWNKVYGTLAHPAIHSVHRRHIKAFKAFAELQYLHRDRSDELLPKKKKAKVRTALRKRRIGN